MMEKLLREVEKALEGERKPIKDLIIYTFKMYHYMACVIAAKLPKSIAIECVMLAYEKRDLLLKFFEENPEVSDTDVTALLKELWLQNDPELLPGLHEVLKEKLH